MTLWLCVLVRVVANPFSNVFQKSLTRRAADPLFIVCVTHGLLSLACLPVFLFCLPPLSAEFWLNITVCTLLSVAGNVLLVQAVRLSDLSVLGPINAYKAVFSLAPGMALLNEFPGWAGLSGIALIVAGSYFLVDKGVSEPGQNVFVRFFRDRGVQYRFAALALTATEAIFLKKAVLASSPLAAFAFWSALGFGVSLAAVAVMFGRERVRHEVGVLGGNWLSYLLLAVTTALMSFCTIYVLEGLQVGYALALFQTSTLLSVMLGHRLFQEGHFVERLLGSAVMVAGAVLIIVGK